MKTKLKKVLKVFFYLFLFTILVSLVIGIVILIKQNSDSEGNLVFIKEEPVENYFLKKVAYISGQVKSPGVYEFEEDSRIADLIGKAGGVTEKADLDFISKHINYSEKLKDEQHIYIPSVEEREVKGANNSIRNNSGNKININSATLDELDTLPGIGASTAQKIIDNRPYESIEGLLDVPGIGDAKFNEIKDLIDVQ